jgi:hypothetical protein
MKHYVTRYWLPRFPLRGQQHFPPRQLPGVLGNGRRHLYRLWQDIWVLLQLPRLSQELGQRLGRLVSALGPVFLGCKPGSPDTHQPGAQTGSLVAPLLCGVGFIVPRRPFLHNSARNIGDKLEGLYPVLVLEWLHLVTWHPSHVRIPSPGVLMGVEELVIIMWPRSFRFLLALSPIRFLCDSTRTHAGRAVRHALDKTNRAGFSPISISSVRFELKLSHGCA